MIKRGTPIIIDGYGGPGTRAAAEFIRYDENGNAVVRHYGATRPPPMSILMRGVRPTLASELREIAQNWINNGMGHISQVGELLVAASQVDKERPR